jgi:large subunit ribosomal protein L17
MRKKVFGKKLSRDTDSRKALFRALLRSLIRDEKIVTTKAKAISIRGDLDKLMKLVAKNDQAARRLLLSRLGNDKKTLEKILRLKPLTEKRNSGFTRITNLKIRKGDGASMVRMELVK